jgi:hypothetical protein
VNKIHWTPSYDRLCLCRFCRQRVPVEPQGVANLKRLRKEFEAALQVFKVGCLTH